MQYIDVLVTCPDRATAAMIARTVLQERLSACANIGPAISSLYWWKGAIEAADEVPLLLKTRATMFDRLSQRVKAMHPYETPCIIAMEFVEVEPAYAAWLEAEIR